MKRFLILLIAVVLISCTSRKKDYVNVIPEPQEATINKGYFEINDSTRIFTNAKTKSIRAFDLLKEKFITSAGINLQLKEKETASNHNKIFLRIKKENELGNEGYLLTVNKDGVKIIAQTPRGLFYGVETLLQLLPPEIFSSSPIKNITWKVPFVKIKDKPRFAYRGMHLDVGRHFFPKEFIKKYIDLIAFHKMNIFHWHLTEDQGWRIEIKKYPKLTQIGAYRSETMGDGKPYGGFYTQEEIKEIAKYAESKFVTIVPEIEMPGHSTAALASYPELSCTGIPFNVATTWGIHKDIYCTGKEKTFKFLEDVLDEVINLFPGKYIHIGGDEAPKDRWKHCPDCQRRIEEEGLKDEQELQSYFTKRIEKYLSSKGKRLIGWDEILEGGLPAEATVMSWRGTKGGIFAAKENHDVIMTPTGYCYFDYYQGDPKNEPVSIGGYLPLSKVYSFEPVPKELTPREAKHIIGAQGNVWTEYIDSEKKAEYMALPRMAALSEVLWTTKNRKNINNFVKRLRTEFKRYDEMNVNYSQSVFSPMINLKPDSVSHKTFLTLTSETNFGEIHYTLDGERPTVKSTLFTKPVELNQTSRVCAGIFNNGKIIGKINCDSVIVHKAFGKKVKLLNGYSKKRSATGRFALTDGLYGSEYFNDGRWQGFEGKDFVAIIDLTKQTEINSISVRFLQKIISWIFLPKYVEFYISEDGQNFKKLERIQNGISERNGKILIKSFSLNAKNKSARYVKIVAANIKTVPKFISEDGGKAWLLVDEITIK